ncbi:armadillo-type protein [Syncephalastrum racemosum]|uniref:Armadillo-type protein n=1 Tax=Syncephalastrum racemosum TaxID=13706 RepID=A0A1X2H1N1_SYNRA|nr:armadillo-type protein [Syncephalastrum racemosum]
MQLPHLWLLCIYFSCHKRIVYRPLDFLKLFRFVVFFFRFLSSFYHFYFSNTLPFPHLLLHLYFCIMLGSESPTSSANIFNDRWYSFDNSSSNGMPMLAASSSRHPLFAPSSSLNDDGDVVSTARSSTSSLSLSDDDGSPYVSSNDYFGRATARLPTPPQHVNLVPDLGIPSPKDEMLPNRSADYYFSAFAPLNKTLWQDETDPLYVPSSRPSPPQLDDASSNALSRVISTLLSKGPLLSSIPADAMRHHLDNAIYAIQALVDRLQGTEAELQKRTQQVWTLQSSLAGKDRDLQAARQQLAAVSQLCDTQAAQLKMATQYGDHQQQQKKSNPSTLQHAKSLNNLTCGWSEDCTSAKTSSHNSRRRASGGDSKISTAASRPGMASSTADYRRRLDKNGNADWSALVDKIIQRGDQHSSIFLQQKLKGGATPDQRQAIFEAVLEQAYPLMTSRFGNFLVQRLFEAGTPDQVRSLMNTMRGRVVDLTCQPFGCHVLQKALDCADEQTRSDMISELFPSVLDTITHKHACHIWQKIFEMQWQNKDLAPPVMMHVNETLQGQWTQVALNETGSLVIQHIFENLPESEKRTVLEEVLANTTTIARGQWGNWVIQHILEHAENSQDRELAFQTVLDHAASLSTDQYASKVVEKALRIGGPMFFSQFLDKITTASTTNTMTGKQPREALIDMAADQYGNYVVQWLINHAADDQQTRMCRMIKRHMVSLRGSKYGQRVAFLVEKVLRQQDITTYPASSTATATKA